MADKVAKSWTSGREASIADYRTEKDVRPMHLRGEAVHYLFPLENAGAPYMEVLSAASRSITHLGWGIDMVAAHASLISEDDAAQLPGEVWRPTDDSSAVGYRVPVPGTLAALVNKHQAFLNRIGPDGFIPVPPLSAFRTVGYRRDSDMPARSYAAFRLLDPETDRAAVFPMIAANRVAAMMRHATALAAEHMPQEWVDRYVHGHRDADVKPILVSPVASSRSAQQPDALLNAALETRRLSRDNPQTADYISGFHDALAGKGDNPWESGRGFRGGQINRWKRGYQDATTLLAGQTIQRGAAHAPEQRRGSRNRPQPIDDSSPRFSYLPLPSIEHRGNRTFVVGDIRRILVAELIESPKSHLRWARQMLPGQFLIEEQSDRKRAMLAPLTSTDWVLRQYKDASDTWATVTPVVLPGSDEGKFNKAEKLFCKALLHAGYPPASLADLEFRNASFWPGTALASQFQRPNYLSMGCWSVYHMRLRWRQPIPGPLCLGAGRHCGLGIFARMPS